MKRSSFIPRLAVPFRQWSPSPSDLQLPAMQKDKCEQYEELIQIRYSD